MTPNTPRTWAAFRLVAGAGNIGCFSAALVFLGYSQGWLLARAFVDGVGAILRPIVGALLGWDAHRIGHDSLWVWGPLVLVALGIGPLAGVAMARWGEIPLGGVLSALTLAFLSGDGLAPRRWLLCLLFCVGVVLAALQPRRLWVLAVALTLAAYAGWELLLRVDFLTGPVGFLALGSGLASLALPSVIAHPVGGDQKARVSDV